MNSTQLAALLLLAGSGPSPDPGAAAPKARADRFLAIDTDDAASYAIYRDADRKKKLELRREPIFRWSNPIAAGGQVGDVFVWTFRGRPEAVATIFSHPHEGGRRTVCHELHSLSGAVLVVDRDSPHRWVPQAPGVELKPIPDAPAPAATAPQRLTQLRALARDFSGRSVDLAGGAWELRILPRPLYRYEGTDPDVIDGALFAAVNSAGTDLEIVLLLEARRRADGPAWMFAGARFSEKDLWLKFKGRDVWESVRGAGEAHYGDARQRSRFSIDRIIPEPDASKP